MTNRNLLRSILAVVGTALLCSTVPAATPVDGQWRAEIPRGKIGEFVFDLQCEDGELRGEVKRGNKGQEPIAEGSCTAESVEFQVHAGKDVWLWTGTLTDDGRLRCVRQKQGKEMRQTVMAER